MVRDLYHANYDAAFLRSDGNTMEGLPLESRLIVQRRLGLGVIFPLPVGVSGGHGQGRSQ